MKTKHIIPLIVALCTLLPASMAAQELRSSYFMQTSLTRHQLNPALLSEKYFSMPVMGNMNISTQGNLGLKNFVYKLDGNPNYDLTTFMNPNISASEFMSDISDKNRLNLYINMNLASVAFKSFGGTNLIELNLRSNTNAVLPGNLFRFMKEAGQQDVYDLEDLGIRSHSYAEFALGHARDINEKLRVGAKVKFLFGIAEAEAKVNKMRLTMSNDQWAVEADAQLSASVGTSEWEYDDMINGQPNRIEGIDDVTPGLSGFGMGIDLGAAYTLNDDWTFSAALNDLGFIGWKNTLQASSRGSYTFDGFDEFYAGGNAEKIGDQFERIGDDLEDMFALYDDGKGSKSTSLATTLNLAAEYTMPFYRNLKAGLLYSGRFAGLYSYNQTMLSLNCRPTSWVEASLNTSVSSTGMGMGGYLGFYTKGFNFYVASDRFIGTLSKEGIPLNSGNANIAFGINFPL